MGVSRRKARWIGAFLVLAPLLLVAVGWSTARYIAYLLFNASPFSFDKGALAWAFALWVAIMVIGGALVAVSFSKQE